MSGVAELYDLSDPESRERGLAAAVSSCRKGRLVVLPTDTVYGIGADAFDADAVRRLLEAKGRGREMPPPVLVSTPTTLDALTTEVPAWVKGLVAECWPGPLTVVCREQPSLRWDLGETMGTVAVRMPDDEGALDLLGRTGPLAVSSANLTGRPAASTAQEAEEMLGDAVAVILDGGPRGEQPGDRLASTILDCTTETPRVLREGALALAELRRLLEGLGASTEELGDPDGDPGSEAGSDPHRDAGEA